MWYNKNKVNYIARRKDINMPILTVTRVSNV